MKTLLVGEAYGEHEALFSHPLVWASGRELARMIGEAKLAPMPPDGFLSEFDMMRHWRRLREECSIAVTNVFNERPPNNDEAHFFTRDGNRDFGPMRIKNTVQYLAPEHAHHVIRLWAEIRDLEPNLIVAMGNTACWALLGTTKISALRGTVRMSPRLNIKILPTLHPAYVLYPGGWGFRPTIVADLMKAARECEYPEIRRQERWLVAHDEINGVRVTIDELTQWFAQGADSYACDIETGRALYSKAEIKRMSPTARALISSMISMVSFARSPSEGCVVPLMERREEGEAPMSYWPRAKDEAAAWRLIINALQSPVPKTFQNGVFDIGHFLRKGIVPRNTRDDTMLRAHAMVIEMPKSLGFLGSIHLDDVAWKMMYGNKDQLKRDE